MATTERTPVVEATEDEIDAVIAEFDGDLRQAIKALLHDLTSIVRDSEAVVSRGFIRRRLLAFSLRENIDKGDPA